jgi:hypothetical protein
LTLDFTLKTYRLLLEALLQKEYQFIKFQDYLLDQSLILNDQLSIVDNSKFKIQNSKIVILRHDVDRKPLNSLHTAKIENALGITGTYYFRIGPESFNEKIIKQIAQFGHEIGYHYEDVDLVLRSQKSIVKNKNLKDSNSTLLQFNNELLIDSAYEMFKVNLERVRKFAEINTICMHGSPLSKYDNKMIWEKYNYKDLELIGEPYFDIDWKKFGYLTDTGRKWDGGDSSVRDKVENKYKFKFHSTQDIIKDIKQLPDKIMITVHPQRWNNNFLPWLNEYFSQNAKNIIKKYFYVNRK